MKITYFISTDTHFPHLKNDADPHIKALDKFKATLTKFLPINFPMLDVIDMDLLNPNDRVSVIQKDGSEYKHCHLVLCPALNAGLSVVEIQHIYQHLHIANPNNKLIVSIICDDFSKLTQAQYQDLISKLEFADEIVVRNPSEQNMLIAVTERMTPPRIQSPDFVIDDSDYKTTSSLINKIKQAAIVPFPKEIISVTEAPSRHVEPEILGFVVADVFRSLIRYSLLPPPLATNDEKNSYLIGECNRADLFQYVYYQGKVIEGQCEGNGKLILFRPLSTLPYLINGHFKDGKMVGMVSSHFNMASPYYKHALQYFEANKGKLRLI